MTGEKLTFQKSGCNPDNAISGSDAINCSGNWKMTEYRSLRKNYYLK
jgi:hypothetical protein